jgi:hypothetical protein
MTDKCPDCSADLDAIYRMTGSRSHRCLALGGIKGIANNKPQAVANTTSVANNTVANKPRWATWRSRNPDLYRERQRDYMRRRRARDGSP